MLIRQYYLDILDKLIGKPVIKILVGMRRVGKSTILKQFMESVGPENCLYIPREDPEYHHISTGKQLYDYVHQHDSDKKFILIDEVQLIQDRESIINGLFTQYGGTKEIIITGSNSYLLSSEISTILRGRTFQVYVYPFSFHEYCSLHQCDKNYFTMLDFLKVGGLPSVYAYDAPEQRIWVEGLINTVFIKDIVARYNIKDVDLLQSILLYICNTIGDQASLTNITNYLKQSYPGINIITIGNYLYYLHQSLLTHEVNMYDMQGKKILDRIRKYYSADHAMRNYIFSSFDGGVGKLLENYCYIALCRAGYKVNVGRIGGKEVDFIAEKHTKKIYVQTAYILTDKEVIEREFSSLKLIKDNRPKYVVTMDPMSIGIIEGIHHIQARDFETILAHLD